VRNPGQRAEDSIPRTRGHYGSASNGHGHCTARHGRLTPFRMRNCSDAPAAAVTLGGLIVLLQNNRCIWLVSTTIQLPQMIGVRKCIHEGIPLSVLL